MKIKKFRVIMGMLALLSSVFLNAQVTIGTNQPPNPNAVLELATVDNSKGFLPPRVQLIAPHSPSPLTAHVEGMVVYNTHPADSLVKGLYINDGTQWMRLRDEPYVIPQWFYMPSVPVRVSSSGSFTVNLWEEYKRQFDNTTPGSHLKSSNPAALKPFSKVYATNELDYYVTGYDTAVFDNVSVAANGVLSYQITPAKLVNVSDSTFMNIVFVVK